MPVLGFVPYRSGPNSPWYRKGGIQKAQPRATPFTPFRPGEPLPEPLKPADIGLPPALLKTLALVAAGIGWKAASQLWGAWNNPSQGPNYYPVPGDFSTTLRPPQGNYSKTGSNRVTRGSYTYRSSNKTGTGPCVNSGVQTRVAQTFTVSGGLKSLSEVFGPIQTCGVLNTGYFAKNSANANTSFGGLTAGSGNDAGYTQIEFSGWTVEPIALVDLGPASELAPWAGTSTPPDPRPLPAVIPAAPPTPRPAFPATVPTAPPAVVPEPEVAPAPAQPGPSRPPVAPPIPRPATTPTVKPAAPVPVVDGVIVPVPAPAPTATPVDVHYPWPNGPGVGPGGTRPDIAAIAQEVGRIEQKLALMPRPGGDPSNPIDWGDLAATLLRIWEAFSASSAGGTYTLSSPCVVNEETEERIVTEVQYSGGLTWLDVLNNKVDALAELQQAAKDLKQPICRHKAEGQPVTVTFTQQ